MASSFEEEMALFETIESESDQSQRSQSQDSQDSLSGSLSMNDIVLGNKRKWGRREAPVLDPTKDSLIFQQLDIEHYVGKFLY